MAIFTTPQICGCYTLWSKKTSKIDANCIVNETKTLVKLKLVDIVNTLLNYASDNATHLG